MTAASGLEAEISVCGFHRTTEVLGTFDINHRVQALLLKQGHPEQVAQDVSPQVLSGLQGWRRHNFCRQAVAVLDHSCCQKVFSCVQL